MNEQLLETSVPVPSLPAYPGIAAERICLVINAQDAAFALEELSKATSLGFDTESKPIFSRGQVSDGPHLIQLATIDYAFLFPVVSREQLALATPVVKAVLESPKILKVGFGLGDDNQRLFQKMGVKIATVLDLSRSLSDNRRKQLGAKTAVAKYFGQALQKSKRVSTSNWAASTLNDRQLKYAADDAQSALLVYLASRQSS